MYQGAAGFVFGAPGFEFGRDSGSASQQLNAPKAPHERAGLASPADPYGKVTVPS